MADTETPVTPGQEPEAQPPSGQESGGPTESAEARVARLERELAETRKEAAKYRTEKRSLEQARLDAEKAAAEEAGNFKALYEQEQAKRAELEAEVAKRDRQQARQNAAAAAGLPLDMADRLVGETDDDLLADAKKLAALLKPTAPSTGATNPGAQRGKEPKLDPKSPPRLTDPNLWKR